MFRSIPRTFRPITQIQVRKFTTSSPFLNSNTNTNSSTTKPLIKPVVNPIHKPVIMAPKIAIVYYSMYNHVHQMAEAEKKGVEAAGATVDLFQIPETLSDDVLAKMHAPSKADVPVLTNPKVLEGYDGILFGVPTRYGNMPAQWKAFWDQTGGIWMAGGFIGKFVGMFVSTGTPGGGQETTFMSCMSTYIHHGMIYVPLGYGDAVAQLTSLTEVHGGSPWGAGSYAGSDGSRQPSALELQVAEIQGRTFVQRISK